MEVEGVNRKYIPSRTAKRYEVLNQGRGIVFRKLKEEQTKIIPESFAKPVASNIVKPTYLKPEEARKKLDEINKNKNVVKVEEKKEEKPVNRISSNANMPSFSNFDDIKNFVTEKQKENSERNKQILQEFRKEKEQEKKQETKLETKEEITNDEQEDIDDLVSGNIQKEQELINEDYLKSLERKTVKRLFKMVTGFKPSNQMTQYEMRKTILSKYKEMPSSKKQLVYEASKLKD